MIKNFFHGIVFTIIGFTCVFSTFAIVVTVPSSQGQEDVVVTSDTTIIESDESTLFATIQLINSYLWFSIGAICM